MDSGSLITIITTMAGLLSGTWAGSRYGRQQALADAANNSSISTNTVEMLGVQVEQLRAANEEHEARNVELAARVTILEDLVTQRAAVAEVHEEVKAARVVLDKIAVKVGV